MNTSRGAHDAPQPAPALHEIVQSRDVGMLATIDGARITSRPVTVIEVQSPDTLWCMIAADSAIAAEVNSNPRICLSIHDSEVGYASLRGAATVLIDQVRIDQLWNSMFSIWFSGPQDPNIALLRIVVQEIEHWDSPATGVGRLLALAKAAITNDDMHSQHSRGAPANR